MTLTRILLVWLAIGAAYIAYLQYGKSLEPPKKAVVSTAPRTPSASASDLSATESITSIRIPDVNGLSDEPYFDTLCFVYENRVTKVSHMDCVRGP